MSDERIIRLSWTQPQCEACWFDAEGEWDLATFAGGDVGQILVSVRMPIRLAEPKIERCAWCGAPTIFGVYKRADPATVPYPASKDDDD